MPNVEIFQRVFWSFKPSIEGFEHCRPVLSIDGTHLYGKYKDTLMIAMECDGNNQLFPLTFSITKCENIDSRVWFLACIKNIVTQRKGICVISDRHLGIMAAMSDPHLVRLHHLPITGLHTSYYKKFYVTLQRYTLEEFGMQSNFSD